MYLCVKNFIFVNYKAKKLIIFDLDGTLIDSVPDLTLAVNNMLSHYDLGHLTLEQVTPMVGNGVSKLVKRALQEVLQSNNIDEHLLNEAIDIYFEAYADNVCEETYLYPGVKETLGYLTKKDYALAICTNKPTDFIEPILDKLEVKKYFKYWIGESGDLEKKPNAAPLLHIAKKMDKPVVQCIMVGDSKNDILAAQNAGMHSIGVSYGYNYNKHISEFNPTTVVDKFDELKKIF